MPRNPGKLAVGGESTSFTFTGRHIDFAAPKVSSVQAIDLAEHLSKQAMYRGATRGLYTAAQHSWFVAKEMAVAEGAQAALYGLFHQAEEAYSGNPAYAPALRSAIHEAFGLPWPMPEIFEGALTHIHECVMLTELRQLCSGGDVEIARLESRGAIPLKYRIIPLGWDRAHQKFVEGLQTYARVAGLPKCPAFGDLL
jgi:hypothetical protein